MLMGAISRHENCPIALFGHADPEGKPGYNKWLSERRAEAVYAVLIRDVDAWERLYSSQAARGEAIGDVWGDTSIEIALNALGHTYDEAASEKLSDAIKRFQTAQGDPNPSGKNDAKLRKDLFFQYMQHICRTKDGLSYALSKKDFLGEGGEHGPFQGCSEFNLQLILAGDESKMYDKDKEFGKQLRHLANEDNRRVVAFLFEQGTKIDPKLWPCPRAKDPARYLQGCIDHLWSDQKDRLNKQYQLRRRRFGKQVRNESDRMSHPEMTFGCRFYHGIAQRSPCERDLQVWAIQLLMDGPKEEGKDGRRLVPAPGVRFVAVLGDTARAAVVRGRTSKQGVLGIPYLGPLPNVTLRLDLAEIAVGTTAIKRIPEIVDMDVPEPAKPPEPPDGKPASEHADTDRFDDEEYFTTFELGPDELFRIKRKEDPPGASPLEPDADEPPVSQEEELEPGVRQRLYNLGYGSGVAEAWTPEQRKRYTIRFQRDFGIKPADGELNELTVDTLFTEYGS
jgi:hypothetical protein